MNPKRGEIWWVNFEPQVGSEIRKSRPSVVVNVNEAGRLPLRIVVPITDFDERRSGLSWFVPIMPSKLNRLRKISQADCFQVKSVSLARFETKIGDLEKESVEEIINAIAVCIGA